MEKQVQRKVENRMEEKENKEVKKIKQKPKIVKHAFLENYGFWSNIKRKLRIGTTVDSDGNVVDIKKTLQEPLLVLMKDNGYTEIIENIKPGEFIMTTTNMGEKSINLSPDKFTTLKYGGQFYKAWVAYENCMSPYPEDPLHNAEVFRKTVTKVSMNYKDRDESAKLFEGKGKMWLLIILGIAICIVLIASSPQVKDMLFGGSGEAVKTVAQAGVQAVKQNLTSGVTVQ